MISEVVSNASAAPTAPAPFAACHVELAALPSGTALGCAVLGRALQEEAEAVTEAGGAAPGPRSAVMALAARCSGRAAGR